MLPFFVSECKLRKRQLTDNLSINFLMINTKAYSPFGYSLWSCSSKACSGKKEGIRKELFFFLYIIKTMFTFAENFTFVTNGYAGPEYICDRVEETKTIVGH